MISGYTGEAFRSDIFIGPVYYQRLRHMVSDKFQVSLAEICSGLTSKQECLDHFMYRKVAAEYIACSGANF